MAEHTLLLYDDAMLAHDPGPDHPESADRLRVIRHAIEAREFEHIRWAAPAPAEDEAILAVHTPEHLEFLTRLEGQVYAIDPDTRLSPGSLGAARIAAGAGVEAVTAVMTGAATNAFALVRPPGHHACADRAMGFCLFNNIAVAAAEAVRRHGCRRVVIIDWDVHHGNGTQDIFYDRSDVLFISVHESPHYPGTGHLSEIGVGDGRGYNVNLPLAPGQTDVDYLALFRSVIRPIVDSYEPDLVLVSAGFDAHQRDPMARMCLGPHGFAGMLAVVREIADKHADGRLALVLEGGYDLQGLAAGVCACVAGLAPRGGPPVESTATKLSVRNDELRRSHAAAWPCLQR